MIDIFVIVAVSIMTIFSIYGTRYFIYAAIAHKHRGSTLPDPPPIETFVTVIIPTFNESRVVDRILQACVSIDYENYEVIVVDDSTDPAALAKLENWKELDRVKIIHRPSREGWKGGAINRGVSAANPNSTHILIFDADFVPPRDIIRVMLSRFTDDSIAAVQGNQWHILNESENWITKSSRAFTAAAYSADVVARAKTGGFLQLLGSVMMLRKDVLSQLGGFRPSMTEDWELGLRLMLKGYKIVYDESIKVPAECPSRFRDYIRQQMRWSEGTTRHFREYFWKVLRSREMNAKEKIDFVLIGAMYLQTVIFFIGNVNFIVFLFLGQLGGYVEVAALSGILYAYSALSLPAIMVIGLHLDGDKASIAWIFKALILGYISYPFIAFSAMKGLLLRKGSRWIRTPKTGRITESFFKKTKVF